MRTFLYFYIFIFFCCACSPSVKHQMDLVILDTNAVQFSKDKQTLIGSGRVLFNQPLFGLYSKELYFIRAELFNEHSSFVLHSHFTGFKTQDGIKVFFIREKSNLLLKISTPSYPEQTVKMIEDYFVKNQVLEVYVETQNGTENFTHVKIWDMYINPSGYVKKNVSFLSRQNLIASSEDLIFYSKGQGMLWGMELNKIRLIDIFRESVNQ